MPVETPRYNTEQEVISAPVRTMSQVLGDRKADLASKVICTVELGQAILSHLDLRSLARCCCVSHEWSKAVCQAGVWAPRWLSIASTRCACLMICSQQCCAADVYGLHRGVHMLHGPRSKGLFQVHRTMFLLERLLARHMQTSDT